MPVWTEIRNGVVVVVAREHRFGGGHCRSCTVKVPFGGGPADCTRCPHHPH